MPAVSLATITWFKEWSVGDVMSLIGLVLAVPGLYIAVYQLRQVRQATEATRDAVRAAGRTQVLFLLPQFRLLETELDYAIEFDRRELASRVLASYAHLAREVAALLDAQSLADSEFTEQLRASAVVASAAKGTLHTSKKGIHAVTASFRESLQEVSTKVSTVQAQTGLRLTEG